MRVQMGAFPAVYFNAVCRKHECRVQVRVTAAPTRNGDTFTSGGSAASLVCEKNDPPQPMGEDCTPDWVMTINGPGPFIILE